MTTNMRIWIRGNKPGEGTTLDDFDRDIVHGLGSGLFAALGLAEDGDPGDIRSSDPGVTFIYQPNCRQDGDYDIVIDVRGYDNSHYEIPPLMTLLEVSRELDAQIICFFDIPETGLAGMVSMRSGDQQEYHLASMED